MLALATVFFGVADPGIIMIGSIFNYHIFFEKVKHFRIFLLLKHNFTQQISRKKLKIIRILDISHGLRKFL